MRQSGPGSERGCEMTWGGPDRVLNSLGGEEYPALGSARLEARFEELAASRTATESLKEGVVSTLRRWAMLGK